MKKQQILGFVLAGLTLCSHSLVQAEDMSATEEWGIKAAIKELSDNYGITRDNDDAVGYANNFAEDGSLILYGNRATGRAAIQARAEGGTPNTVRMHVLTSSAINIIDAKHATGVHYMTVYSGQRSDDHKDGDTVDIANFRVMGKYHDKYVLTDDGWKFAERRLEPIFRATD